MLDSYCVMFTHVWNIGSKTGDLCKCGRSSLPNPDGSSSPAAQAHATYIAHLDRQRRHQFAIQVRKTFRVIKGGKDL